MSDVTVEPKNDFRFVLNRKDVKIRFLDVFDPNAAHQIKTRSGEIRKAHHKYVVIVNCEFRMLI